MRRITTSDSGDKMPEEFVPITNLDNLNEAQKKQYLITVCEYFKIPSTLGLLEYMKLEGGDGAMHTVLYAKKGATDLIRDLRGISITDTQDKITDKLAMFTVKGVDKNGRTEISVGASSIDGLIGKELGNQVMAAHTKATRRLTLQFVGGGFLDESEVQQTEVTKSMKGMVSLPPTIPQVKAGASSEVQPTAEQLEARKILAKMDPTTLAKAVGEEPKRIRRSKAVDFAAPPTVSTEFSFDESAAPEPVPVAAPVPAPEPVKVFIPEPIVPSEVPTILDVVLGLPTPEQSKEFRVRLTRYTEEILPKAGMVPSEKIGGIPSKVRLFVMKRYELFDLKKMTVDQWTSLLDFFDAQSPDELVKIIDEAIQ
jgi:hypothetical protein